MTTTTAVPTVTHHRIPLSRIVTTELRKTIDTRSGFWTVAAIVIVSMLTTGAVILWADLEDLTYRTFTAAISVPLTLALPIIAILSVTSEWSQRTGLTTFALVPHRGRIVLAKAIALRPARGRRDPGRLHHRRPRQRRRARPSPVSTRSGT